MAGERRRKLGVRVRLTGFATLIVAVALVTGALLLTNLLRGRLDEASTTAALLRARDVAGLAAGGNLPPVLSLPGQESAVVQVVDPTGAVLAASENIDGEPPVSARRPLRGQELVYDAAVDALDSHESMRLVAVAADTATGPVTVYAAESLDRAAETVSAIVALLAAAIPTLVVLVASLTWWAVGRTLRPVRTITSTLAEITATDLHRRVPDPDTNDDIGRLATTVNDTLQRLDTAVERQRRFVADASHELRGPLAALRADLEVSTTHPERTDWHSVAAGTLGDVARLQQLTDDLLVLARFGTERTAVPQTPVDLSELVLDEGNRLHRNGIAVAVDVPREGAVVHGSAPQLRRMVRNLFHNAEQHAATRVDIGLRSRQGRALLTIADDGPGIAPEDRARVLEPFVRVDSARTRDTGGTGLGLAIVREIVAAHHGVLTFEDNAPTGVIVKVGLPATDRRRLASSIS